MRDVVRLGPDGVVGILCALDVRGASRRVAGKGTRARLAVAEASAVHLLWAVLADARRVDLSHMAAERRLVGEGAGTTALWLNALNAPGAIPPLFFAAAIELGPVVILPWRAPAMPQRWPDHDTTLAKLQCHLQLLLDSVRSLLHLQRRHHIRRARHCG